MYKQPEPEISLLVESEQPARDGLPWELTLSAEALCLYPSQIYRGRLNDTIGMPLTLVCNDRNSAAADFVVLLCDMCFFGSIALPSVVG